MAASICVRTVLGKKWGRVNRYPCFMTIINQRTFFNKPQSISGKYCRNAKGFPTTELKYNGCSANSEVMFSDRVCTHLTFNNISQGRGNNNLHSGKSNNLRSYGIELPNMKNSVRHYSDGKGPPGNVMDFPELIWPNVIKTVRNWILANLIITPYFDQDFKLPDFVFGSKQALQYVSGCLSRGDYDSLKGLTSEEALQEVKKNIATFSVQQRQLLAISKDDIYFSFPYQIGVMFNDDDTNQRRFVEITMVYHILQGLKELQESEIPQTLNMGMMPEYQDRVYICNYRFIREFTKGVEDDWTINVLNHFKPVKSTKEYN